MSTNILRDKRLWRFSCSPALAKQSQLLRCDGFVPGQGGTADYSDPRERGTPNGCHPIRLRLASTFGRIREIFRVGRFLC